MNKPKLALALVFAFSLACSHPLLAQRERVSPHETISRQFDGNLVQVVYGRPYSKDPKSGETRKIWGGVVPYGKVWRTGADEATLLTTKKPLTFGETTVPAGAYSLFTLPAEDGTAKLIISKQVGEWGAYDYDEKHDLARIDLKKGKTESAVGEFTIALDKGESATAGVLKMSWENTEFSAPFTVGK